MSFSTYLNIAYTIISLSKYYDRVSKVYFCYTYTKWIASIIYNNLPDKKLVELEDLYDDEDLDEWYTVCDEDYTIDDHG